MVLSIVIWGYVKVATWLRARQTLLANSLQLLSLTFKSHLPFFHFLFAWSSTCCTNKGTKKVKFAWSNTAGSWAQHSDLILMTGSFKSSGWEKRTHLQGWGWKVHSLGTSRYWGSWCVREASQRYPPSWLVTLPAYVLHPSLESHAWKAS